jgi:hypothetical protein
MGILRSGPFGPFRKKTGPIIGRGHMGQNVISALHHKSTKAPTAKQIESQLKLALLNSFLSKIDKLVDIGFKKQVKHNSPVNAAFSHNYKHAFVQDGEELKLDYPQLVYSIGHVMEAESPVVLALPGQIEFNWLPQNQSAYCQYTDLASFLVYNPAKKKAVTKVGLVNRYAQGFLIDLPNDYLGDTVHCYMSFASKDVKLQGNSSYIGEVICK